MKMNWKELKATRRWAVAAVALGAMVVSSASVRADDDPDEAPRSTFVRVLHAVPAGPKVDIYFNGKKTLNDYKFGGQSKYLRMPAGYHRVSIVKNEPMRTLFSGNLNLRLNRFYTVVAYGNKTAPRFRLLDETLGAVRPTRARVMVSHYSPGAPPVDVVARSASGRWMRLANRVAFGQTRHVLVPPGAYTLYVRSGRGNVLKMITGVELQAGRRYSAFAIGRVGANDGNAFTVLLDPAASQ